MASLKDQEMEILKVAAAWKGLGPSAVRIPHVLMVREIVIITLIVKEHFSVAMTTVQVDRQEWTAAHMMVIEICYFNTVILV